MKILSRVVLIVFSMMFLVGYRTYSKSYYWQISAADPKLYLRFCQNMTSTTNDVDAGDSLAGAGLTHQLIVDSVVNDYNAVTSSYVRLGDSATDGTYNAGTHVQRVIDICTGGVPIGIAGFTVRSYSGWKITGCRITIGNFSASAKRIVRILTHEIGHCLSLDHPQETRYAVMSYFSDAYRLQDDDKAGLTYMFPADSNYRRNANFGMACAPNN
jgi:hypothetical protein